MCSLSMALMGLTTGLSAVGTYQQSRAQAAALEAQSQAAQNAADAAYQNAEIERKKGEIEAENNAAKEKKMREQQRLIASSNNATAGAMGILGNMGSGLDVDDSSMDALQADLYKHLQNQRYYNFGNQLNVTNLKNQGHAYTAQAHNYQAQASAAKEAGILNAVGTVANAYVGARLAGMGSQGSQDTLAGSAKSMPGLSTPASIKDISQQAMIDNMKNNTGAFAFPNTVVTTWGGRKLKAYNPTGFGTGNMPYITF